MSGEGFINGPVDGQKGEHWFIADGGSGGATWATYRLRPGGTLKRVIDPALPIRSCRLDAEVDLAVYLCQRLGDPRWVVRIIRALRALGSTAASG